MADSSYIYIYIISVIGSVFIFLYNVVPEALRLINWAYNRIIRQSLSFCYKPPLPETSVSKWWVVEPLFFKGVFVDTTHFSKRLFDFLEFRPVLIKKQKKKYEIFRTCPAQESIWCHANII